MVLPSPFWKIQNLWLLNNFVSLNMGSGDDPRLAQSLYQTKIAQNHASLKNEFKTLLNPNISFIALKTYLASPCQTKT